MAKIIDNTIIGIHYNSYEEAVRAQSETGYFQIDKAIVNPPSIIYSAEEIEQKLTKVENSNNIENILNLSTLFLEQVPLERLISFRDKMKKIREESDPIANMKERDKEDYMNFDIVDSNKLFLYVNREISRRTNEYEPHLKEILSRKKGNTHWSTKYIDMAISKFKSKEKKV